MKLEKSDILSYLAIHFHSKGKTPRNMSAFFSDVMGADGSVTIRLLITSIIT